MRVILESLLFWWTVPLTGHFIASFTHCKASDIPAAFVFELTLINRAGLVVVWWWNADPHWVLPGFWFCVVCIAAGYSDSSTCLSMLSSHDNWSSLQMSSHSSVLPMSHSSPPNSNSRWDHTLPLQFYCNKMYIYIFIYIHIYIYIFLFFIIYFFYEVINNPPHKFPCFFLEVLNIW